MKEVPIQLGNLGFVLKILGGIYPTPADALKEHISNAIDEWLKSGLSRFAKSGLQ